MSKPKISLDRQTEVVKESIEDRIDLGQVTPTVPEKETNKVSKKDTPVRAYGRIVKCELYSR